MLSPNIERIKIKHTKSVFTRTSTGKISYTEKACSKEMTYIWAIGEPNCTIHVTICLLFIHPLYVGGKWIEPVTAHTKQFPCGSLEIMQIIRIHRIILNILLLFVGSFCRNFYQQGISIVKEFIKTAA